MVSSLSQKQQSIKLNQRGIEVFREYYPKIEEAIFLECVWETDRFILLERKSEPESKNPETITDDIIRQSLSTVEYQSIEVILGDDNLEDIMMDKTSVEDTATISTDNLSSMEGLTNDCKQIDYQNDLRDQSGVQDSSIKNIEHKQLPSSSLVAHSDPPQPKPEQKKKVAFISVKRHEPPKTNNTRLLNKPSDSVDDKKEDAFFSLLTGGYRKMVIFDKLMK